MVKAIVTTEFKGVEDGAIYPRVFKPGEIITGSLALAEIENGRAKPEKKPLAKALTGPERNKSLPASQPGQVSEKAILKNSKTKPK